MARGWQRLLPMMGMLCAAALATSLAAKPGPDLAIVDVSVAPMTSDQILPHQTVIVRDGRIATIGPASGTHVPKRARRIDGRGRTLLPGLADMHVHIGVGDDPATRNDGALVEARAAQFLGMFLDAGVTTVRDMAGGPLQRQIREAARAGRIAAPHIYLASPVLETRFTMADMEDYAWKVASAEEGRRRVQAAVADGYDFIKVYNQIDPPIYASIIDEAQNLGIPVVGHVPFDVGLAGALAARQKSIEHFRSYDFALDVRDLSGKPFKRYVGWLNSSDARMDEVAKATAAASTWNVPTLVTAQALRTDEQMKSFTLSPDVDRAPDWLQASLRRMDLLLFFSNEDRKITQAALDVQKQMLKRLADAGAPLMIGTDTTALGIVPGWSVHDELALFVEGGLTPYQALRAATVEPARFLGRLDESGTVEKGKVADLVLIEGNPLAMITSSRRIVGTIIGGSWHPSTANSQSTAR